MFISKKSIKTILIIIILFVIFISFAYFYFINYPDKNRKITEYNYDEKEILKYSDIIIEKPKIQEEISSPLLIKGKAKGTWYFEAAFPIVLVDWDGLIISETYAQAREDWMTENFVLFTANIDFENPYKKEDPSFTKKGTLIFKKANPSGLPENDDFIELPILFR